MKVMTWIRAAAAVTALAVVAGSAAGAEGAKREKIERKGPLAGLPSAPGPHLEKIKALGDNEWLNLGSPAPDPTWGKARGRSWSCWMPYAPDLQGAFLAGQGKHGFISPEGRYDDLFFYDVNAHRWICLFPGLNTRTFVEDIRNGRLKVNDDGQLVDKDGQPVFYAYGGHSYHTHTYDADRRLWIASGGRSGLGGDQYSRNMAWEKEGKALLAEQMKGKTDKVSGAPIVYNTVTGRFERSPIEGLKPHGFGNLFYLPTTKVLWDFARGETLLSDTSGRRWLKAGAKGATPQGIDFAMCYDTKRHRIYVGGGSYRGPYAKGEGKIYVYDIQSNTWTNLPDKGALPFWFGTNVCCMHYDSVNDRVVCFTHSLEKRESLVNVFDPTTGAWDDKPLAVPFGTFPPGKALTLGKENAEPDKITWRPAKAPDRVPAGVPSETCWHGFYSAEVNAHFIYTAHDSSDRGNMWVYRYRKAAKQ